VVVKSVSRFVNHSIGPEPQAERDMEEMGCTTCDEVSGCLPYDECQMWALKHAGRKAHFGFRLITTNYYRVVRHEDGPPEAPALLSPHPVQVGTAEQV
jgi:hypothetical protein